MATNSYNCAVKLYFKWDIPPELDKVELREELREAALVTVLSQGSNGFTCGELKYQPIGKRGTVITGWFDTETTDEDDD